MTPPLSACCREAIRKLKIPQLLTNEFLELCIKSRMPVPLVREEWEALRREVGAAFVAMISIISFQNTPRADEEFGQSASILFRDRSKRAYTFAATADSSRASLTQSTPTGLWSRPPESQSEIGPQRHVGPHLIDAPSHATHPYALYRRTLSSA